MLHYHIPNYCVGAIVQRFSKKFYLRTQNTTKRIFWSLDHQTDDEILDLTQKELEKAQVKLQDATAKRSFIDNYRRAKTEIIAKSDHLAGYELVQADQMPSNTEILAAWLIKNQTKAILSTDNVVMDFRAPIEIEALLAPQNLM